eukprot:scaffold12431_cov94-Cyclotella_meneghiniana.AAC.4
MLWELPLGHINSYYSVLPYSKIKEPSVCAVFPQKSVEEVAPDKFRKPCATNHSTLLALALVLKGSKFFAIAMCISHTTRSRCRRVELSFVINHLIPIQLTSQPCPFVLKMLITWYAMT